MEREGLAVACERGHMEAFRYFVHDRNVDVHTVFRYDMTPVKYACQSNHLAIVRTIVEHHRAPLVPNMLWLAVRFDAIDVVRYLIHECKMDVREQRTGILHTAVQFGSAALIKVLIDHGADHSALPDYAKTIMLKQFCESGDAGLVDLTRALIREWGFDLQEIGQQLFEEAIMDRKFGLVRCLVEDMNIIVTPRIVQLCFWSSRGPDQQQNWKIADYCIRNVSPARHGKIPEQWRGG